jgi:hypothetical protein
MTAAHRRRAERWVGEHRGRGCDGDPAVLVEAEIPITMLANG